jgi:hypothetical protein
MLLLGRLEADSLAHRLGLRLEDAGEFVENLAVLQKNGPNAGGALVERAKRSSTRRFVSSIRARSGV